MSKLIVLFVILLNWGKQSLEVSLWAARAKSSQFPWLIQFQTIIPCGGILVSPDWVLTAAQCVQFNRNSITLYATGLNGTQSGQTIGVKATYIFPEYQAYSTAHDKEHNIALLKLIQPFDMCDDNVKLLDVSPIRLDDYYKTCFIFGWQSYVAPSTKVLAKPIQYSHVLLNSWEVCMYMLKGNTSYNNVFCAIVDAEDGIKACAGNPGSPVVCEDQYQQMTLLGIASWSNFSLDCAGIPTYLGLSVFRSWINDLILNDKVMEERNNDGKPNKNTCRHDQHPGSMTAGTNIWNYSNLSRFRLNIDQKPIDRLWKPLWTEIVEKEIHEQGSSLSKIPVIPPRLENAVYTNYSRLNSKYGIPFDILRRRDEDNFKQYQEVGQSRETANRMVDTVAEFPAVQIKSSHSGDKNIEKNHDKEIRKSTTISTGDELYDLDFMMPLDEDYLFGRSHTLHFQSRWFCTTLYLVTVVYFIF